MSYDPWINYYIWVNYFIWSPASFFFFFLHVIIQIRHSSFSTEWSWYSCQKLICHRCLDLFMVSQFYSIGLYVYLYASTMLVDYCSFVVSFEFGKYKSSQLCFGFPVLFWLFEALYRSIINLKVGFLFLQTDHLNL